MFVSVPKADAIFMKVNFCIFVFFCILYYLFILFFEKIYSLYIVTYHMIILACYHLKHKNGVFCVFKNCS